MLINYLTVLSALVFIGSAFTLLMVFFHWRVVALKSPFEFEYPLFWPAVAGILLSAPLLILFFLRA